MKCLKCWRTITPENRQNYKAGLRLPYCRDCVQRYIMTERLSKLSPKQREKYVEETIAEMKKIGEYSEEDLEDAEIRMKGVGFNDAETDKILGALRGRKK